MSLLGLIRHLAKIEHHWFRRTLERQEDLPILYWTEEEPDLDFDGARGTESCVAEAWQSWRREVAHARKVYARYDDLGENFVPGEPWQGARRHRAPDRGVRPTLRARRPVARVCRRAHRPVGASPPGVCRVARSVLRLRWERPG